MSNPENAATQNEPTVQSDSTPSIEEQLNTAEQRRRETQASFTKGQQEIKALKAEKEELMRQLAGKAEVKLTSEQKSELDTLKYEDPDAWRVKVNELETAARNEHTANIANLTGEAKKAAEDAFELERRQQVLKEFNDSAAVPITDELIANDVPPRITNKLAEGKITFEEYLSEVQTYISKGKVVANEETLGQPSMGNLGGGVTPTDMKPETSLSDSYAGDIY